MATKKPSAKKSAKSASAPTTMTATLVPAKPWHSRGAVAIVLVVAIAVLAVGFAAAGVTWSNNLKKLRNEVAVLKQELNKAQENTASMSKTEPFTVILEDAGSTSAGEFGDQRVVKVNTTTGARMVVVASVRAALVGEPLAEGLRLISIPVGSNAAYFTTTAGTHVASFNQQPIYRLNLASGQFAKLAHTTGIFSFYPSPDGHYLAVYAAGRRVEVVNLDTDAIVASFDPPSGKGLCEFDRIDSEASIYWQSHVEAVVTLCAGNGNTPVDSHLVTLQLER